MIACRTGYGKISTMRLGRAWGVVIWTKLLGRKRQTNQHAGEFSAVTGTRLLHPNLSSRPHAAFQQEMLSACPEITLTILLIYTRYG